MTTPTNPINLSDIQTEFGGTNPISLSEYYRNGVNVPSSQGDGGFGVIPTSGPISMGVFRNQEKDFVFIDTVSSNLLTGYNLATRATAAGWNGTAKIVAHVTVSSGVYISNPSGSAFVSGTIPASSITLLTNHGIIVGYGGAGGVGGSVAGSSFSNGTAGSVGRAGLDFSHPITVTNNGIIGGGGGGGGGGGAARHDPGKQMYGGSGGGGGGGRINAVGGAAGTSTGNDTNGVASAGATATLIAPGAGGARYTVPGVIGTGAGGAGGDMGYPGFTGNTPDQSFVNGGQSSPGAGGSPGNAVLQGANVTWVSYGTINGDMDDAGTFQGGGASNTSFVDNMNNRALPTPRIGAWTAAMGSTWYWNSYTASTSAPIATLTFSCLYENTTGSNISAHLFGAIDNSLVSMAVNGSPVTPGTTMPLNTTSSTNSFNLTPGLNVITIQVNNVSVGPAGMAVRLRRTADNVTLADIDRWYS